MRKKSKRNKVETDFKTEIPEYNDEQILDILKKRKYYQHEAVELAMAEALRRKLINSEQDLQDVNFEVQPLQSKLFPIIEDDKNKTKLRKSIARAVLISGIIPTIWGFLKINNGINLEGMLLVTLGLTWIYLSAKLIQKFNHKILNILIVLSTLSMLYVGKSLLIEGKLIFTDVFIILVLYSLLIYGLLFIRQLNT